MAYFPDLGALLTEGHSVTQDEITYTIRRFELGPLVLPTGEIVGCDPLVSHTEPFTDTVPPGQYSLVAWVAVISKDGEEQQRRIAALQLVISAEPPVSWTMAAFAGQDPSSLGETELFGYGVDAGTGTLADRVAIQALETWEYDQIEDVFIPAKIPDDPVEAVISTVVDEASGANVYVVNSGWGDGFYATYAGRDGDGQITSFVTDFAVLPID